MRFRSSINNANSTFYTDLNGFQLIKRRTNDKIPLAGNFYPMPTTAVLQDENIRLTLHTGQPLGVASLEEGEFIDGLKQFLECNFLLGSSYISVASCQSYVVAIDS